MTSLDSILKSINTIKYKVEKCHRFNREKEELEFYWIVSYTYETTKKKWFKTIIEENKGFVGDIKLYGSIPYTSVKIKTYEFSTKAKAEQYIKDIKETTIKRDD